MVIDRGDRYSGLRKFLVELDRCARGCVVSIFSAIKNHAMDDIRAAVHDVEGNLARRGVREVNLHLIDNYHFGKIAHDRYVRFDRAVCEVGIGVDIFSGQKLQGTTTFSLKAASQAHRKIESDLRQATVV